MRNAKSTTFSVLLVFRSRFCISKETVLGQARHRSAHFFDLNQPVHPARIGVAIPEHTVMDRETVRRRILRSQFVDAYNIRRSLACQKILSF